MKKLFVVLFIIAANIMLAQGGGGQVPQTELNVQIFNNQSGATIDFIMEPIIGSNSRYSRIYLDDLNAICTFPTVSVSYVNTNYPNTITLTDVANYCTANGWGYGLDVGTQSCSNVDSDGESFQSGLYKVTVELNGVEKTNFFYDNRHSQFPANPCLLGGFVRNDIGVRYDVDNNKLYYRSPPTSNQDPPSPFNGWEEFIMGEVINWWDFGNSTGTYDVSGFQTRYFAILNEPVKVNESPSLSWIAPNVTLPLDHFEVQRAWGSSGNFITIHSTNGLTYHDQEITWLDGIPLEMILVQYRIATVFYKPTIPYGFSNIRKIMARNILEKKNSFTNYNDHSFSLEQNYPNPFNPTTTISYKIGKDGYVTLNVFNLLGEEVATLVNQQQQKGNYEVKFDAAGLTSGIYFYRISSNGIVLNKKLILTK